MNAVILNQVQDEIESMHTFLGMWFRGEIAESEFEKQFLYRFSPDLIFIPPAGRFLNFNDLSMSIRSGYATNPAFRIQIRNVAVHQELDGHILATYEEWQRNARASQPADNGRIATVLFSTGNQLEWKHIHETWLPIQTMVADLYDF